MTRRVLLLAALAVCGPPAGAQPVHVALEWSAGRRPSTLARVRIHAMRTDGTTGDGVEAQSEAEAGLDGVVLDLSDGIWQIQASSAGYWSQGTEVVVSRQAPVRVRLALWPAASLHGEIVTAEGEPLPGALEVRLSATPASDETSSPRALTPRPEPSPSRAELRCQIDQGTWSCPGPAGLFDVQLEVSGYAPRYEWGVTLNSAQSTDLGRTVLRRGASVFGRAVGREGSSPPGPCRATLRAEMERRGAPEPNLEGVPDGKTTFSVPLSQRGYFQVLGVPPGRQLLTIECPGASSVRELRVRAGGETRINPPMALEELTLEIAITPKVDPQGRPWQLTVDATVPRLRRIADKTMISADGRWARRGLTVGSYRITVNSSDGMPWLQRFFNLSAESGPLSLRLPFMRVEGVVRLSMRPVRARLVFFNQAGGEPATLTSGDDGYFEGLLPVTPGVQETNWTIEARAAQPPISRRLVGVNVQSVGQASAWLELALPVFAVRGTVVSEAGQPQTGAQVAFEDTSSGARASTATDDSGAFELAGLAPGKYTAVAESLDGVSDRTAFQVAEGIESELKLVLNPSERIPFYVVSSQGPVADASVQVWIPPGVPRWFTRTDSEGRFEVKLPPGTTEVGLTVGAQGYALKLTRLQISRESDKSPNANTIPLDASGGTLVLDPQPPGRALDTSMTPYLVHKGAIEAVGTLAGWAADQADGSSQGPAVVETIEPGVYSLCMVVDPAELAALWLGAMRSDSCRTGSVEQADTLTLSPP